MILNNEQRLIDIMYDIGLTIHSNNWFKNKNKGEVAGWISEKLNNCGFIVKPCGASGGVLRRIK